MTIINLAALHRALGVARPIATGRITATYWAGDAPFRFIDGADVIFPRPIVIEIVEGAPDEQLVLVPTEGICCVRIEIEDYDTSGPSVVLFVAIPDVPNIDVGDLVIVDPMSFVPIDQTPTLIETIDARIAANPADPAAIEAAVGEYLAENPPSSGFQHTQSVALATWTIPHSLGRVPNIAIYVAGELVETDVTASPSSATVTFPIPTAGVAVLN